ncbi:GNAT family N-acetyltransferase [Paenibacillus thalictri]|uniref:GNAT family N-acetyltransferase n=1 Tax=Paenibacillus thalictri TaxID=2527873 RepID=A0A4Q9DE76_9BACL|nr:GNAT family N-acetyltransferase [Paenibacillus thalictri]TBL68286.1 GNAT family N-acetyltransferase [Paenibacillus thalictri]
MKYIRITDIRDVYFKQMHDLMKMVFPPEEVLAFELWAEPLADPGIRVFVAVEDGKVVGATEYRYYPEMEVAMTDFTIIGREGLGVGPFLVRERERDLLAVVSENGTRLKGMFAEIYNPYLVKDFAFGGIKPMDPFVRREVLAHIGYRRLELDYVHPSWQLDGEAVGELDLCFLPYEQGIEEVSGELVERFLTTYYAVHEHKPQQWHDMVHEAGKRAAIRLLPI